MVAKMPRKCPICGSTRLHGSAVRFACLKCGYAYGPKSMSFRTADKLKKF